MTTEDLIADIRAVGDMLRDAAEVTALLEARQALFPACPYTRASRFDAGLVQANVEARLFGKIRTLALAGHPERAASLRRSLLIRADDAFRSAMIARLKLAEAA